MGVTANRPQVAGQDTSVYYVIFIWRGLMIIPGQCYSNSPGAVLLPGKPSTPAVYYAGCWVHCTLLLHPTHRGATICYVQETRINHGKQQTSLRRMFRGAGERYQRAANEIKSFAKAY